MSGQTLHLASSIVFSNITMVQYVLSTLSMIWNGEDKHFSFKPNIEVSLLKIIKDHKVQQLS